MNTMTFKTTVPKEQDLDPKFFSDTEKFYDEILLSIDEIEQWTFIGIEQEPFGDYITLRVKFSVLERKDSR